MIKLQGYVYRYVDIFSGDIAYVGIVYPGHSLRARLQKEWKSFEWLTDSVYKLEYQIFNDISQTDLQAIEAHLINIYHTPYNIQKRSWGESAYITIDEANWEEYEYHSFNEIEQMRNKIIELQAKLQEKEEISL